MVRRREAPGRGLAVLMVAGLASSCNQVAATDAGQDRDVADGPLPDGEAEADAEVDWVPGPLVLVVSEAEVLEDRTCDLDGDGDLDNAIADLGSPMSSLMAMALNSALASSLIDQFRLLFHFPRLDGPPGQIDGEVVMIVWKGLDADYPADPDDDFSGEEPFFARADSLDACGEPLFVWPGARLEAGHLAGRGVTLALAFGESGVTLRGDFDGRLAADGTSMEAVACTYAPVAEAGRAELGEGDVEGLSPLELLLFGGAAFGIPGAGLAPDVDVDGDGLERFTLDADGHIESCIDGDGYTVIPGRDCWQDPRMADGISLTVRLVATTARYAGREPGWEQVVLGTCEAGMPEQSLFGDIVHEGACVAEGERCDPLAVAPCCEPGQVCRGMHYGAYLCARRCTAWPCDYGDRRGACFGGLCHVLAGTAARTRAWKQPACLELCQPEPVGCDEAAPRCISLIHEDDGYCT